MVVEGLGKKIEKLTTKLEVAKATKDIPTLGRLPAGVIRKGTVAGQHYEWTAWVDGAPFMVYHFYWTMGEDIEPRWDIGDSCYRVVIKGDPPLEVRLMGGAEADGRRPFLGLPWTGTGRRHRRAGGLRRQARRGHPSRPGRRTTAWPGAPVIG